MPSASTQTEKAMEECFPNGYDDFIAITHLKSAGFKQLGWEWELPTEDYKMTKCDYACISYLFEEWDWGGLIR